MTDKNTGNNLTVDVDFSSFSLSEKGVITGEICLSTGSRFFPEKQWNDFAVEILGWWLSDYNQMMQNNEREQDFVFKDGDFCFLLTEEDNLHWRISMYEEVPPQNAVDEVTVPKKEFLENLISAAKRVLEFCSEKSWHTAEVESLLSIYRLMK